MSTAVLKSHNLFLTSAKVEKLANHGEFFGQLRNENGIAAAVVAFVLGVNDLCNGVVNSRRPPTHRRRGLVVAEALNVQFLAALPIARPRIWFHYCIGRKNIRKE